MPGLARMENEVNAISKLKAAISTVKAGDVLPTIFERDGTLFVSAEDGGYFADYYGEYRGGYPWIDPRLESAATKAGFYWEWENPGCIYVVRA
jgi:hypothetical protein